MGKHYCDYCDVFLTHDSVSVRKAHNSGRNHLQNVREYYQTLDPEQIQQVIDTLAQEYDRRGIEKPRDLLQPAGSSFMTFGAGPLSGASDRGTLHARAWLHFDSFHMRATLLTAVTLYPLPFGDSFRISRSTSHVDGWKRWRRQQRHGSTERRLWKRPGRLQPIQWKQCALERSRTPAKL